MEESNPQNTSQPAELPTPARGGALILRLILVAVIVGGTALLFLYKGGWFSPHALTQAKIINEFERENGEHTGFRRNHAKGVCVSGYFDSNGNGATLSKSKVFPSGRIPVLGRISLAGGQPYQVDAIHTVRSLALLFQLPDGEEWRTAMINLPVFPAKSPQNFYDLIVATAPDPATGKPDPAKIKVFFEKYPESAKAIQIISSQPVTASGFADDTYNGLNAFLFIDAQGKATPVRWSMVPVQPSPPTNSPAISSTDTNVLFDALISDIHTHPLQWHLIVTIGQSGDSTADATTAWPSDRQKVDVGTLTIDHVESEDTSPVRNLTFDPLILPNGIAGSDDPILSARSAAYAVSFTRREGEPKNPSAVSPAETAK